MTNELRDDPPRDTAISSAGGNPVGCRRSDEEPVHSLAVMRAALELSTDGVFGVDADRRVTVFNRNYVRMWRIPDDLMDSCDSRRIIEYCSRQVADPLEYRTRVDEIYATSPPESFDVLELADGRVFERYSRVQQDDGRNVGRVWSFRDISQRRRVESALKDQSDLFRVTLGSIGDAVLTTDADGNVSSLNTVAEKLTGWPQDQAKGRPLEEVFRIVNEQTRQPVADPARRALAEGRIVGLGNHTLLISRDGRETPIDDSAAPIRDEDGRVHGAVLVFRDILKRRTTERALQNSERELADFFENAAVGLHWVGADGTILKANRAELDTLGYSREEYVGRHLSEFHVDRDVVEDVMGRLRAGETVRDCAARMRCKDGSIKHVLIDASVLWEDGKFVHTRCFTRDVTDRKKVWETQARLAAIVESSDDAIVSKSINSRIQSWNSAAERLFGYTAEEAVGQLVHIIIPPERQDEEQAIIDRLLRGERIDHFETVRVSKSGRPIDVSLTISPVRDDKGRIVGASKIARDITERRQAEQALRRSEAQFRQLADAMPQMVWTARADGYIDYYNERWYQFTGVPRDRFGDASWTPILHPDDVRRAADAYYECVRSETPYQIEYRFKDRRSGGYRWFLGRAHPVRDDQGKVVRWFGTSTDIDDTKRAEERTRFLADASAALAQLTDHQSTLQKVAALAVPLFADWCSVDMAEPDGTFRNLGIVHRDPAKAGRCPPFPPRDSGPHSIAGVLRSGKSDWVPVIDEPALAEMTGDEEQLRCFRELGLKSFICTPIRSRTQAIGVLNFATTDSGRVYDASDLAAAEDLAHRAAVAIENATLLAALKEADRRKDEFLAILAHELRNPLAPVRNAVQIIRRKGSAVPELQWSTEIIDRQIQQMTRLVDDLLDVSRITRGKIELRKERVELSTIVNSAVEACRPLIDKWGHELTVSLPPQPIFLQADVTRLTQVLLNLLNNAAKYTEQGGRISLTVEANRGEVVIRVRDTGIGIPKAHLPHVFDMFTQVESALDRSQGGLGIGLTLVKRLVELHGGSVEARSEGPGTGSEFSVRLPVAVRPTDGERPGTAGDGDVAAPTCRILVVDDNRDAADSLGMLLRMLGNEVHTAYDGLEAVGAVAAFRPQVVLLDLGLPKLNGYEAARRMREHDRGNKLILIALTGWGQEDDRRKSKEAGFDYHLTKPVDFSALQGLLLSLDLHRPR